MGRSPRTGSKTSSMRPSAPHCPRTMAPKRRAIRSCDYNRQSLRKFASAVSCLYLAPIVRPLSCRWRICAVFLLDPPLFSFVFLFGIVLLEFGSETNRSVFVQMALSQSSTHLWKRLVIHLGLTG